MQQMFRDGKNRILVSLHTNILQNTKQQLKRYAEAEEMSIGDAINELVHKHIKKGGSVV